MDGVGWGGVGGGGDAAILAAFLRTVMGKGRRDWVKEGVKYKKEQEMLGYQGKYREKMFLSVS